MMFCKLPLFGCAAVFVICSCGSSSGGAPGSGGSGVSGAAGSSSGSSDSGAAGSSLGGNGSSAAGSSSQGGAAGSGVSPGRASIAFTVAGTDSYCATVDDCGDGSPTIGIDGLSTGREGCNSVDCDTCRAFACLQIVCQNEMGVAVTGGRLDWDGTYGTQSTCGMGTACVGAAFAKPGKYTATMCATPGTLTTSDAGPAQCVPTGPAKCGHVEFDFPSSVVAMGTIGP